MDDLINRQEALNIRFNDAINEDGVLYVPLRDFTNGLKALPSTQPESVRINLNESIKVKLTDWGKEIYYHQYDKINQTAGKTICNSKFPKEDENGYTEFQLWCFMELYGKYMGMTLPNVIKPLEIVYERRAKWTI